LGAYNINEVRLEISRLTAGGIPRVIHRSQTPEKKMKREGVPKPFLNGTESTRCPSLAVLLQKILHYWEIEKERGRGILQFLISKAEEKSPAAGWNPSWDYILQGTLGSWQKNLSSTPVKERVGGNLCR